MGGLGIGSLKAQNNALLCKWWWRFLTEKDTLWNDVISVIHGSSGGLGDSISIGKCPGLWRNILKVGKELENLNMGFSSLFQFDPDITLSSSNAWSWRLSITGIFSVASFRLFFDELTLPSRHTFQFKWLSLVPKKINVHAWRINHRRLATKVNLARRGIQLTSLMCPFCNVAEESEEHIFVGCKFARELIQFIANWWNINSGSITSLDQVLNWHESCSLKGRKSNLFQGVIYVFLWLVWNFRNEVIFKGKDVKEFSNASMILVGKSFFWMKYRSKIKEAQLQWSEWCENPWS